MQEPTTTNQAEGKKPRKRAKVAVEGEFEQTEGAAQVFTVYCFGFPYETDIADFIQQNLAKQPMGIRAHTWHDSGKSKGCAHLDFATAEEQALAIAALEGKTVGSRYVSATVANEQQLTGTSGEDKKPAKRLFVKNLPYEMSEDELKHLFQTKFGEVASVRIPHWNHTGNSKGFGYVEFAALEEAEKCMLYHTTNKPLSLQGRRLVLDYDSGAPKRGFKLESGRAWYKA
ncbi:hypothetical protein BASA81_010549 [Batrachochytrium salamandrivorans]|nr:hypothetical protein BASA81_010549 [Batrachochytrium salamandrivorans]